MIAKFKLSHNGTDTQLRKKQKKESEIEEVVRNELQHRKDNWDPRRGRFETFQDWYIQYRKDAWHRYFKGLLFYCNLI